MIYQYGIRWTTSRGRDTYGYNICTMTGEGLKGRCIGGGYDMLGATFAQIVMQQFPEFFDGTINHTDSVLKSLYGMRRMPDGTFHLDGSCGCDCVERVVTELIGASVEWEYARDRKGRPTHRTGVIIKR